MFKPCSINSRLPVPQASANMLGWLAAGQHYRSLEVRAVSSHPVCRSRRTRQPPHLQSIAPDQSSLSRPDHPLLFLYAPLNIIRRVPNFRSRPQRLRHAISQKSIERRHIGLPILPPHPADLPRRQPDQAPSPAFSA